jgi:hypothetical protein
MGVGWAELQMADALIFRSASNRAELRTGLRSGSISALA